MRKPWRIAAISIFLAALLFGGIFGGRVLAVTDQGRDTLRLYSEVVEAARANYGADISYQDLVEASIQGMIRTLDPHTNFLPRQAYDTMRDRQQETFSGLGILVGQRDGQLTVITPIEGTPASRLGIRAGDVISTIEGDPTETMSVDEAVRRLKGPKGTQVTIEIVRRGLPEPLELVITRAEIPQTTVRYSYMLTPEVGYIALVDFNRGTGKEMAAAIEGLREQGMTKLLLDLRSNGGGLLDQAIAVANLFVPAGESIVETRGRTRDSFQDFDADEDVERVDAPVVVLVSDGTASAAEILSGAIQDHDIGLIVGTPTWGKGLVQTVYSLSYGNGIAVTTAKYYTPSGRLIQRDYSSWFDYANYSTAHALEDEAEAGPKPAESEAFHTDLGREVYGGGGITPDVIVEPTMLTPFVTYLLARNAFFNFAVEQNNLHPVNDPDWQPDDATLDKFHQWVLDEGLIDLEDFDEAMHDPDNRATVRRYLRAEALSAAFGLEARHRILSEGDVQIQHALQLFDQAAHLLAERRGLGESPEGTRIGAAGALR